MRTCRPLLCSFLLSIACDGASAVTLDAGSVDVSDAGSMRTPDAGPARLPSTIGTDERPASLIVPSAHDGTTPLPLVVLLHGYTASGNVQDLYWGLSAETRARGFYLVIPDGTTDARGNQFWNATPACCDFEGTQVDDSSYLIGLVHEVEALAPVRDVYFVGHSNGGFMSYRMACDHADRVTAIGSLAGGGFDAEEDCTPSQPVSVLQIHGDLDETIPYDGVAGRYPSAPVLVARWAARAGCRDVETPGEPLDLDTSIEGAETTVVNRDRDCAGGDAALWTIVGGSHVPQVTGGEFSSRLLDWLDVHRR